VSERVRGTDGSEGRVRGARQVEDEFQVGWIDNSRHRKRDNRDASERVKKESYQRQAARETSEETKERDWSGFREKDGIGDKCKSGLKSRVAN